MINTERLVSSNYFIRKEVASLTFQTSTFPENDSFVSIDRSCSICDIFPLVLLCLLLFAHLEECFQILAFMHTCVHLSGISGV